MLCQSRDSNPRHTPKRAGLQKVAAEKLVAVVIPKLGTHGEIRTHTFTDFKSVACYLLGYMGINIFMLYCKEVLLESLDEIRSSFFKIVPEEYLEHPKLFYPKDSLDLFLSIDPLKDFLKSAGWLDKINKAGIALNVVAPQSEIAVHVDNGNFPYSFNIPITHCQQSFVHFYKTKKEISETKLNVRKTPWTAYYLLNKEDCDIIKTYELTVPYLMNTKILHNVDNMSDDKRITLLVRLSRDAI